MNTTHLAIAVLVFVALTGIVWFTWGMVNRLRADLADRTARKAAEAEAEADGQG